MIARTLRFAALALALLGAACSDSPTGVTLPTEGAHRTGDAPAVDVEAVTARSSTAGPVDGEGWHFRTPILYSSINYCADYGGEAEGEWFTVEGTLHERYAITRDAHGNLKIRVHSNPAGLQGTAWESGARYKVVGNYRYMDFEAPGYSYPITVAFQESWHFVTPGGGNDLYVRRHGRLTIDEAGNVTRDDFRYTTECR